MAVVYAAICFHCYCCARVIIIVVGCRLLPLSPFGLREYFVNMVRHYAMTQPLLFRFIFHYWVGWSHHLRLVICHAMKYEHYTLLLFSRQALRHCRHYHCHLLLCRFRLHYCRGETALHGSTISYHIPREQRVKPHCRHYAMYWFMLPLFTHYTPHVRITTVYVAFTYIHMAYYTPYYATVYVDE